MRAAVRLAFGGASTGSRIFEVLRRADPRRGPRLAGGSAITGYRWAERRLRATARTTRTDDDGRSDIVACYTMGGFYIPAAIALARRSHVAPR